MHRSLRIAAAAALFACAAGAASAQVDARMMRQPDVSATEIVFVYAGDVWVVPKAGGEARRLSTPPGEEAFPRFSPDGKSIAYTANYDGNPDVYVLPAAGGEAKRVTNHPDVDRLVDWTPDGSLLVASPRESGRPDRFEKLFVVPAAGGAPKALPMPYGEFGAFSPDGSVLAYQPISTEFRTWKRYRGGMASEIWLLDLKTKKAERLPSTGANDALPMWRGATLYFMSDRGPEKRNNIWAFDTKTKAMRQVTHYADYDIHFPAIGPQDIVFEQGGKLLLLGLADEKVREVPVKVATDEATLRPRAESAAKYVQNGSISPSGKRAAIEARGDVFSVPAENGPVFNVTRTSGAAERYPAFSPDGKSLAYFSDESGEYELYVRPADGTGAARKVTALGPGFRYHIFWSPDSKRVVFVDQAMRINLCDVATGKVDVIDRGLYMFHGDLEAFSVDWSADSRFVAYGRDAANRNTVAFVYDVKEAKLHQATADFYAAACPAFDPEGKYLFVVTNRDFNPIYSDLDNSFIYANTSQIAAIALRRDVPSLLAPKNDVEEPKKDEAKKEEPKKDEAAKGAAAKPAEAKAAEAKDEKKDEKGPAPVTIDFEGLEERLVVLPLPAGNYDGLKAVEGKLVIRRRPRTGAADEKSPLVLFDLKEREEKTILADVDGFEVSADGKKILVAKKDDWAVVSVAPDQKMDKKLDFAALRTTVDPRAEWRQIFNDVWRIERDYFYDPGMHKVDWPAMKERYGKLLEGAVTRSDVNFVLGELIGEMNASHSYRFGGDLERSKQQNVGLLGCDFEPEGRAFKIKRILHGAPWDAEARSPLAQPGVNVKEGEYLLAVNRVPLDPTQDVYAAFTGLAGKAALLTVNSKPTTEGARDVLVETLGDDSRLRYLDWIEGKRAYVEKRGGGRLGYVYVPSTGVDGQTELVRQFRGQVQKDGLVIDERFNSGGQIPDRFIELLNRPLYNFWGVRDGADWQWPPVSNVGPKAMLINGWSGSGGDAFPFYFKKAGLGPLIGRRTWGGLIGISGAPTLIDGGGVTAPNFGIYSLDHKWIIEGYGVDPDIEVVDDPSLMLAGGDPQLDRAIDEVLARLKTNPPPRPAKPAYPDRAN